MTEQSLLRPCPFCGVEVKRCDQPDLPGILHPENDCLLAGELWTFDELKRWNARSENSGAQLVEALTAVRAYYFLANPTDLTEAYVCDLVCGALNEIGGDALKLAEQVRCGLLMNTLRQSREIFNAICRIAFLDSDIANAAERQVKVIDAVLGKTGNNQ